MCDPVVDFAAAAALARDMFDTMYDAPGRGLAAPQVGVLLRMFVMDVTWKEGVKSPLVCINPEIVTASDDMATVEEGCLSIPNVLASVQRPTSITLRWSDETGAPHMRAMTDFWARCAQHELDHLNGVVTFDRVDPSQRAELIQAYKGART